METSPFQQIEYEMSKSCILNVSTFSASFHLFVQFDETTRFSGANAFVYLLFFCRSCAIESKNKAQGSTWLACWLLFVYMLYSCLLDRQRSRDCVHTTLDIQVTKSKYVILHVHTFGSYCMECLAGIIERAAMCSLLSYDDQYDI